MSSDTLLQTWDKTWLFFLLPRLSITVLIKKTATNPLDNICNESFHFNSQEYQLIDYDNAHVFCKSQVKSPNIVAKLICRAAVSPAGT